MNDEQAKARLILVGVPTETAEKFIKHHKKHPYFWPCFQRFTLDAIAAGKKMGAKAISERVRWEVEISRKGEFKVNNNYVSYYARIFEFKYPQHAGYFEKRKITGLKRAA